MRADATAPVDLAQRNAPFAPAATVAPGLQTPSRNEVVQERRVEKNPVEKKLATVGDRHAALDVQENQAKTVREKASHRPEVVEQPVSAFNHRAAPFATGTETTTPPTVTKYQESLKAASATNMAQYPAFDRATTAKLNRFVFRKNSPDPTPVTNGAPVTGAGSATARN